MEIQLIPPQNEEMSRRLENASLTGEDNTILHLAVERRQQQLGEILRATGGAATETAQLVQNLQPTEQTAAPETTQLVQSLQPTEQTTQLVQSLQPTEQTAAQEITQLAQSLQPTEQIAAPETTQLVQSLQPTEQTAAPNNNPSLCINWESIKCLFFRFQGGLNPPGGFAQYADMGKKFTESDEKIEAGQALVAHRLVGFLFWDIATLLFSLSVILLIICGCPQLKGMITMSIIMTWIAFSTGMTFISAIFDVVFPNRAAEPSMTILVVTWKLIFNVLAWHQLTRFHIFVYGHISRYINRRTRRDERTRCSFLFTTRFPLLLFIKVCMVASCIATGCALFYLFP